MSDGKVPAEVIAKLSQRLAALSDHSEILVVANGVDQHAAHALAELVAEVPDVTVHFMADVVERDVATLVGMDRALGDWVIVMTPTEGEVAALPRLIAAMQGNEVVFAAPPSPEVSGPYAASGRIFFGLSGWLAGAPLEWPTPRLRAYSRAACRWLSNRLDGAVLMRSLSFRGAFPGHRVVAPELSGDARRSTLTESILRALAHIGSASTLPLRLAVALALGGVVAGLIALVYTVVVYSTHSGVQPGWTTMTALLSVMMIVFSALFALLTAYTLAMYTSIQPRNRMPVVRELRSAVRRLDRSLDIAGSLAPAALGAPPDAMPDIRPVTETR